MSETIKIFTDRLGLPADATADQISAKVHTLCDELEKKDQQIKLWMERTEKLGAELSEGRKAIERVKHMEAQLFAEKAIREQRIDKAEEPILLSMYKLDKALAEKWVADRVERMYLAIEQGIGGGDDVEVSALEEIDARAKVLMDRDKTLTQASARIQVLRENPALSDRYRRETVAGLQTGGDR